MKEKACRKKRKPLKSYAFYRKITGGILSMKQSRILYIYE